MTWPQSVGSRFAPNKKIKTAKERGGKGHRRVRPARPKVRENGRKRPPKRPPKVRRNGRPKSAKTAAQKSTKKLQKNAQKFVSIFFLRTKSVSRTNHFYFSVRNSHFHCQLEGCSVKRGQGREILEKKGQGDSAKRAVKAKPSCQEDPF